MSSPYQPGYGQPSNYLSPKISFGWIAESWSIYISGIGSWLLLYLGAGGVIMLVAVLLDLVTPGGLKSVKSAAASAFSSDDIVLLFYPILLIVGVTVSCCSADLAVRHVRREMQGRAGIFRGMRNFFPMLGFVLLYCAACMAGITALCVGVFVVWAFLLPAWALIGDGEPIFEAITKSVQGMKRDWLNASLFVFVFYLLQYIGSTVTCWLGALALYPMFFIISALAYRDMVGMPMSAASAYYPPGDQPSDQTGVWPPPPA